MEIEEPVVVKATAAPAQAEAIELPQQPPEALTYLGKNLKKVAILVHYPREIYLPEEQLDFLTAILKACQLNMADIAIVNQARHRVTLAALSKVLDTRQLIVFGAFSETATMSDFFTIRELDGIQILHAPALELLNTPSTNGKQLKSSLWVCLKQLFNV
ncbi:MAG: hypothetical protein H7Y03_01400 [Chitinophagaceae bacterium]|nr:hypothetical protein [Chitinophagaceae bacterium]